jgi:hypothetical protein
MTCQHQREIVFTSFDRGEQGRETFHGFICSWVALNAALSARYAVGGDRAKVRLLARELEPLCTVRIVCHSFKPLKKIELAEVMAECVEELAGEQNVEFAFLTVGTEHPFAISDLAQEASNCAAAGARASTRPSAGRSSRSLAGASS